MEPTETAWVAGLLEGEGCFSLKIHESGSPRMEIRCNMTDEDVIRKLHSLCGGRVRGPIQKAAPIKGGGLPKPQWLWTMGRRAGCEALMREILPHMGQRRSAKIGQILELGERFPAKGWRHGRYAWEVKLCACDECREAFNKHHREYRARRKARESKEDT